MNISKQKREVTLTYQRAKIIQRVLRYYGEVRGSKLYNVAMWKNIKVLENEVEAVDAIDKANIPEGFAELTKGLDLSPQAINETIASASGEVKEVLEARLKFVEEHEQYLKDNEFTATFYVVPVEDFPSELSMNTLEILEAFIDDEVSTETEE